MSSIYLNKQFFSFSIKIYYTPHSSSYFNGRHKVNEIQCNYEIIIIIKIVDFSYYARANLD